MAGGAVLPEDHLRIGEPAANRQSVLSAIMEALRGEESVGGVIPRDVDVLSPEERTAALTRRFNIPPKDTEDFAGVRFKSPPRPGGAVRAGEAPAREGFWEWTDEKGVKHVTDKPGTAPRDARFIPHEAPTVSIGGQNLYGEATPEALGVLRKAAETDEQRESRLIREISTETGKDIGEATKAFRGARREITGEAAKPKTYEEKVTRRDEAISNTERLIKQNPQDREEILRQFSQKMNLEGLVGLKKPEQTIKATIEGQQVDVPVSKWKPEYGTESKGKDTANIREATWLINNKIAKDEKEAYRMVRKATAKETTEKEWAIKIKLMLEEDVLLEEDDRQRKYDDLMKWFRNLPGKEKQAVETKARPAPTTAGKEAWLKNVMKRHGFDRAKAERAYEMKSRS